MGINDTGKWTIGGVVLFYCKGYFVKASFNKATDSLADGRFMLAKSMFGHMVFIIVFYQTAFPNFLRVMYTIVRKMDKHTVIPQAPLYSIG
jgi:hypothetical protein